MSLAAVDLGRRDMMQRDVEAEISAVAKEAARLVVEKFGRLKIQVDCAIGVGVWGFGDVLQVAVVFETGVLYGVM